LGGDEIDKKRMKYYVKFFGNSLFQLSIIKKTEQEIEEGDKVYLFNNVVIGVIDIVKDRIAVIKNFSDNGFKNNFLIKSGDNIIFRGTGVGDSNGLIKLILPRDIETPEGSVLYLDDASGDVVGKFMRDDYENQKTTREVYFKLLENPYEIFQVEI
jgi:hypothetical protein